jgi:hypothetical protein
MYFFMTFIRPIVSLAFYRAYIKNDLAKYKMEQDPTLTMEEARWMAEYDILQNKVPALQLPTPIECWRIVITLGKCVFWFMVTVIVLALFSMFHQSMQSSKEAKVSEPSNAQQSWNLAFGKCLTDQGAIHDQKVRKVIETGANPEGIDISDPLNGSFEAGQFCTSKLGPEPDKEAAKSKPSKTTPDEAINMVQMCAHNPGAHWRADQDPFVICADEIRKAYPDAKFDVKDIIRPAAKPLPEAPPVVPEPSEYQLCLWQAEADQKRGAITEAGADAALKSCEALPGHQEK